MLKHTTPGGEAVGLHLYIRFDGHIYSEKYSVQANKDSVLLTVQAATQYTDTLATDPIALQNLCFGYNSTRRMCRESADELCYH